jgi:hypothetical protein
MGGVRDAAFRSSVRTLLCPWRWDFVAPDADGRGAPRPLRRGALPPGRFRRRDRITLRRCMRCGLWNPHWHARGWTVVLATPGRLKHLCQHRRVEGGHGGLVPAPFHDGDALQCLLRPRVGWLPHEHHVIPDARSHSAPGARRAGAVLAMLDLAYRTLVIPLQPVKPEHKQEDSEATVNAKT